jgi:hypothetical protein
MFDLYFYQQCNFLNKYGSTIILDFIMNYFTTDWQIYQSYLLGGNFWEENNEFSNFIQNKVKQKPENINIKLNSEKITSDDETILFLKNNKCNFTNDELSNYKQLLVEKEKEIYRKKYKGKVVYKCLTPLE